MKILVTGGAGFIGGHLVRKLADSAAGEIVILDNFHRACTPEHPASVRVMRGDIREISTVESAIQGCEVVFHLAAQSNVMGAVADAGYAFGSNVAGTFNVLQAARKAGVKRVVFPSSREVYGDPKEIPVRETAPLRPKNAYGASKVAGETYCRLAAHEGLEVAILRLANVYGTRDRDRVIPLFAEAAAAAKPLIVFGDRKTLDFVWISTVVDAMVKAGFGRWIRGPINIGSGKGVKIDELARRIVGLTNSPSEVRVVPERTAEVSRYVADIGRAKRLLGLPEPDDPLWALQRILSDRTVV